MPVLRTLNPQAEAAIARTVGELAAEQEALAAIVSAAIPAGAEGEIAVDVLAALPRSLAPGSCCARCASGGGARPARGCCRSSTP